MKIHNEIMPDGRIILHIKENDGTPVTAKEMSTEQATGLVFRWALAVLKEQKEQRLIIEDTLGVNELIIALREKPKYQETEQRP